METIFRLLPGVVCVGGMALCMVLMGGMRRRSSSADATKNLAGSKDVAALRDEVARLRSELEQRVGQPVS